MSLVLLVLTVVLEKINNQYIQRRVYFHSLIITFITNHTGYKTHEKMIHLQLITEIEVCVRIARCVPTCMGTRRNSVHSLKNH